MIIVDATIWTGGAKVCHRAKIIKRDGKRLALCGCGLEIKKYQAINPKRCGFKVYPCSCCNP